MVLVFIAMWVGAETRLGYPNSLVYQFITFIPIFKKTFGDGSESTGLHVQIGYQPVLASCCYGQIAYFETAVRSLVGKIPNNILDLGKRLYNARSFWCAGHFFEKWMDKQPWRKTLPHPLAFYVQFDYEDSTGRQEQVLLQVLCPHGHCGGFLQQ
jgi:hypothetical protein